MGELPLLVFTSGVGLNAIGVFTSSMFQVNMVTTLIVLGVVVTLVTVSGGAWAILASDFVQMILLVTITFSAALLTLTFLLHSRSQHLERLLETKVEPPPPPGISKKSHPIQFGSPSLPHSASTPSLLVTGVIEKTPSATDPSRSIEPERCSWNKSLLLFSPNRAQ